MNIFYVDLKVLGHWYQSFLSTILVHYNIVFNVR